MKYLLILAITMISVPLMANNNIVKGIKIDMKINGQQMMTDNGGVDWFAVQVRDLSNQKAKNIELKINDRKAKYSDDYGKTWHRQSESIEKNNSLIYPNPADEYIKIDLKSYNEVSIFNVYGELMFTTNTYRQIIDISTLSSGYYKIIIMTSDKNYNYNFIKM